MFRSIQMNTENTDIRKGQEQGVASQIIGEKVIPG